jgi:hypothetical protein
MLSGGTEQIVPVMGGGTRQRSRKNKRARSRASRRASRSAYCSALKGGSNAYILKSSDAVPDEILPATIRMTTLDEVELTDDSIISMPTLSLDGLHTIVDKYTKAQKGLWQRHSTSGINSDSAKIIHKDVCDGLFLSDSSKKIGISGYDRLGYILPKETSKIVLLPYCVGNPITYSKCVKVIEEEQDKNTVFIFTPPFYSPVETKDNRTIFYHFIDMKQRLADAGGPSMHIITEFTQENLYNGCKLSSDITKKEIISMLEPSYIIYPGVLSMDDSSIKGILFSARAYNEVVLPASNSSSKAGLMDAVKKGIVGGHAWPPNSLQNDKLINKSSLPYKSYGFFPNMKDAVELKTSGDTVTTILINAVTKVGNNAITKTGSNAETVTVGGGDQDTHFVATVKPANAPEQVINVGKGNYTLRTPTKSNNVINDWQNLRFTEGEVIFLNDMNIRPDYLAKMYAKKYKASKNWKDDLAESMRTIVQSNCFKDYRLVLNKECEKSQKFITDVLDYYVNNNEAIVSLDIDEHVAKNHELRKKLDELKTKQASITVDTTGWDKDPFKDGLIIKTNQRDISPEGNMDTIIDKDNNYIRIVITFNRQNRQQTIGHIVCLNSKCSNISAADEYLDKLYKRIKTEYPGYDYWP